jgi:hypothetical protein
MPNIWASAITNNEWDDGIVGNVEFTVFDGNLLTLSSAILCRIGHLGASLGVLQTEWRAPPFAE